jgi:hypothetical protein
MRRLKIEASALGKCRELAGKNELTSDWANQSEAMADICGREGMSGTLKLPVCAAEGGACAAAASSCDTDAPLHSETSLTPSSFMSAAALCAGVCCG